MLNINYYYVYLVQLDKVVRHSVYASIFSCPGLVLGEMGSSIIIKSAFRKYFRIILRIV